MKNVMDLTVADVKQAYVGKPGHCCCGCKGRHYVKSEDGASNGAKVNAKKVAEVLAKVQSEPASVEWASAEVACLEADGKLYIVYTNEW